MLRTNKNFLMQSVMRLNVGIILLMAMETQVLAAKFQVGGGYFRGITVSKPVKSAKELQSRDVVYQKLDYSCGAAALATLLKTQVNLQKSETEIIEFVLKTGDPVKIVERQGFSLLDLKRFVDHQGYLADGYRLNLDELAAFEIPVIVPISVHDYRHFVVVRGFHKGHVFLSDPAKGRLSLPVHQFERYWMAASDTSRNLGIALVISAPLQPKEKQSPVIPPTDHLFLEGQNMRHTVKERTMRVTPVRGEF